MDWACQLVLQRGIDPALALHPGKTFKSGRNQPDMEMGFAVAAVGASGAGMTGMAAALILDLQRQGRESGCQLFADIGGDAHGMEHLFRMQNVKRYVSLSFTLSIP